ATLAAFYERERRWSDAAAAYARIVARAPRNLEVKTRYAQTLLNAGGRDNIVKARDVLTEVVAGRGTDAFALYLLSQAQRRSGDGQAAEASARRVIAFDARCARGHYGLGGARWPGHSASVTSFRRSWTNWRQSWRKTAASRHRRRDSTSRFCCRTSGSRTRSSDSTTRQSRRSTKRAAPRRRTPRWRR